MGNEALELLPRAAVGAPSLTVHKARLDGQLAHDRAWNWVGFKVPSNPSHSMSVQNVPEV